jgi:hypothetical protein
MKHAFRTITAAALVAAAFSAHAAATCDTNAMTDERTCHSTYVFPAGGGIYTLTQVGSIPALYATVPDVGQDRWHITRVLIRVDGAAPLVLTPGAAKSDPDCSGHRCHWGGTALVPLTPAQWQTVTAGTTVLLAMGNVDGRVSDPIQLDPAKLRAALADMAAEGLTP